MGDEDGIITIEHFLNLHVHDFLISGYQFVSYLYHGLKGYICFLK